MKNCKAAKKQHCFNEITGQLVIVNDFGYQTVIPGSAGNAAELLTLLFDRTAIADAWNEIGDEEAAERIRRHEAATAKPASAKPAAAPVRVAS